MNKRKIITGILSASLLLQPMVAVSSYADTQIHTTQVLKQGMKSESITMLQQRLKELGYFQQETTGYFGSITKEAVKRFQEDHRLIADGIVGSKTIGALNEEGEQTPPVSRGAERTEISDWTWFGKIKDLVPRETVFKITDVETGKEFYAKRTYGTNHADSETLTKEDTEVMKALYGDSWSWNRRAIIVEVDGLKLPASMAAMPHGSDFIANNEMNGHFDIHFLNSKTHGTNRVDPAHQKAVQQASEFLRKGI